MFFFVDGAATFDRNPFGRQTFGRQTFGRETQIETCQPFDHLVAQFHQFLWQQSRTAFARIILNV